MASTLTALKFDTPEGADLALGTLEDLSKRELIQLHDAAIVTWPADKKKPKTRQINNLAGAGALSGAFWGLLFGLLFFVPIFGMAVGAAMGALAGSMADIGINDDFIKSVREKIKPGSSALFLLSSNAVQDKVFEEMRQYNFEILATNLSDADEKKLREAFQEEE